MAVNTKPKLGDDAALSVRGLTVDLPKGMERAHIAPPASSYSETKDGRPILCLVQRQ
jgi:peptide/nickel transport system ATP-binding protein